MCKTALSCPSIKIATNSAKQTKGQALFNSIDSINLILRFYGFTGRMMCDGFAALRYTVCSAIMVVAL
jgi:hypothetical protein